MLKTDYETHVFHLHVTNLDRKSGTLSLLFDRASTHLFSSATSTSQSPSSNGAYYGQHQLMFIWSSPSLPEAAHLTVVFILAHSCLPPHCCLVAPAVWKELVVLLRQLITWTVWIATRAARQTFQAEKRRRNIQTMPMTDEHEGDPWWRMASELSNTVAQRDIFFSNDYVIATFGHVQLTTKQTWHRKRGCERPQQKEGVTFAT